MRKALALLGILAGLAIYVAAFFINAPTEICITQPTPPAAFATGANSAVATPAISSKVWVVLVATRCEETYPATGLHTSDLILEWGPSAIASPASSPQHQPSGSGSATAPKKPNTSDHSTT